MSTVPERHAPETRTVLVVEDDREMRRLLALVLRAEGWRVVEATDGVEAARQLLSGPAPDLVVTDVRLPGLSGLDVLARARLRDPGTSVLVITAFGDADTHDRARKLGAAGVLDKPFPLDELRRVVRGLSNR